MFEQLQDFHVAFVVGPHRSGTTICARMIAQDTGHRFVIEDDIGFSNGEMMKEQLDIGDPVVIQCPFFLPYIDTVGHHTKLDPDDFCVVMMHRYRKDIEVSEEKARRVNFAGLGENQKRQYGINSPLHVSDVKYAAWEKQRTKIKHAFDVGYLELADHPLWVEDRSKFTFQHSLNRKIPEGFIDGINLAQEVQVRSRVSRRPG